MVYYKILFLFCVLCLLLPATIEIGLQLYAQSLCDAYNNASRGDGPTGMVIDGENFVTFLCFSIPIKLTYIKGICFILGSLFFIFILSVVLFDSKEFPTSLFFDEMNVERESLEINETCEDIKNEETL